MNRYIIACMVTVGFAIFAADQPAKEIKKVRVTETRADSGVEMFKTYCATCHGVDGKGNGPAASALKTSPTDLTLLSQKNGGKFPSGRVTHVIQGQDDINAHGSSEMPLWGPVFQSLSAGNDSLVKLRISNLAKYIESLQK